MNSKELSAAIVFLRNRNLSFGSISKKLDVKKGRAIEIFKREKLKQEKANPHSLSSLGLDCRAIGVISKMMMPPQSFLDDGQAPYLEEIPQIQEPHILTIFALRDFVEKTPHWIEIASGLCGEKTLGELKKFAADHGLL
jgi:hypothetical protein